MAKFKVGDKVIGNDLANKYGITCKGWVGYVNVVIDSETIRVASRREKGGMRVDAECFDLFDKETPKETPREFKVGDRVRVNEIGLREWDILENEGVDLGTVIVYNNKDSIGIQFDKNFGGHDCGGKGKNGHSWWLTDREIELVKEEPKEESTPTPVVNVNVTVNLYENACWYCRKGGLVDLYLAGAMGICPSCGRVCNNIIPTKPKREVVVEFKPHKENKPLTKEELDALPNGTKVFTVWHDNLIAKGGKPDWTDPKTTWRTKNNSRFEWSGGFTDSNSKYALYYLEEPERPF